MKKINKLFIPLLAVSLFAAACSKDSDDIPVLEDSEYIGTLTVNIEGNAFNNENVVVEIDPSDIEGKIDIELQKVRFAPNMPVTLDVTIPGVPASVDKNGNITFSGTDIVPLAMGGKYPKYTVTSLNGTSNGKTCSFTLNFGTFPTSYTGRAK